HPSNGCQLGLSLGGRQFQHGGCAVRQGGKCPQQQDGIAGLPHGQLGRLARTHAGAMQARGGGGRRHALGKGFHWLQDDRLLREHALAAHRQRGRARQVELAAVGADDGGPCRENCRHVSLLPFVIGRSSSCCPASR